MKIKDNIAYIENSLLCAAIWGDTKCKQQNEPRFTGYVNANVDSVGRAFIEYCIARVMGIFRLPQCGYDNYLNTKCFYYALDEQMVSNACEELSCVIKHVQKQLDKSGIAKNGKITVVRCLAPFQVSAVVEQLKNDFKEIEYPVSIFSSYSYDGNVDQIYPTGERDDYNKHINIKEDVPIDKIILWDKYVGNGLQECYNMHSMFDCERELWVVDTSITGRKKLPRSCFYATSGLPKARSVYIRRDEFGKDEAVYSGKYIKRPCEMNDIMTRFCINRNLKKIKAEEEKLSL